ncbi:glycine C-acetyltransferase [Amycolatopsis circi]|uniref:glycine C-acetyltransferase n=1 Tax=Amycolatopsis circi TaxID=871959 RepID=UPI000E281695|nr:glycine C-acetyltransferase [Amycolatopsis circi]
MTYASVQTELRTALDELRAADLYKIEHRLTSPQSARLVVDGREVLNFCSNNYLGLADHPAVIDAAKHALETRGFGMASVRFICGTQTEHADLESRLSTLLGTDATILYSSCFDANGGVFATLLDERDAVLSHTLNHASIIDGIRLSKARRHRYRTLTELETQLSTPARRRLIVTDGVFSMDGSIAPLRDICDLADRYDAMVMVDDSHAVGILGPTGAGTPELLGVQDRVDIVTGTLGKALGGASGGYVSGHAEIVELLRQHSRPYLFSNALPPAIVAGALAALDLAADPSRRVALHRNTATFRTRMERSGFHLLPGERPIVPIMFGDAGDAARVAELMRRSGVYVTAFSYPVVPMGEARIRVQISSEHSRDDLDRCVAAFVAARDAELVRRT